jgi:phosphonate transport system substrate-binding protein
MRQQPLIFATFLAPSLYKTCLYITEYIERYTGNLTFLLPGEDLEDFETGAIDAGFISGVAYVHLSSLQPTQVELAAVPVLQPQRTSFQYTPLALSDIVVRKNSMFTTIEDLQGCVWASYKKGHHEKPPYTEYQDMHETFFEQMPFKDHIVSCSHLQSLRLLLDGTVDAVAIDSHLLDEILQYSPKMVSRLRIIGSFNASTMPPIVISTQVNSLLRERIREALLSIHQNPFFAQRLKESSIERFLPVTDEYYKVIRERLRKAQAKCTCH